MASPYDILSGYSEGRISSSEAIRRLHLDGFRELVIALADAGFSLPKPHPDEVRKQVREALPLLKAALKTAQERRQDA